MICFQMSSFRFLSILQPNRVRISSNSIHIDINMQKKLERLSLISFQNEKTIKKVEQTIHTSDIIRQVNVDQVEPLYTLVENELCPLRRKDTISNEKTLQIEQVLENAFKSYENYLIAPMIGKRESQTVEKIDKTTL